MTPETKKQLRDAMHAAYGALTIRGCGPSDPTIVLLDGALSALALLAQQEPEVVTGRVDHPLNRLYPTPEFRQAWQVAQQETPAHERTPCECRKALETLVQQIDAIHADEHYKSVWVSYALHGGDYTNGPKYNKELETARAAIASPCCDQPKEPAPCPTCATLRRDLDREEHSHMQTIGDRDLYAEQIRGAHMALGGDGEWTSCRDLGTEVVNMVAELAQERDSLRSELTTERQERQKEQRETAELIGWILGERGDFPHRPEGAGLFWWRSELRQRLQKREEEEPRGE